MNNQNILSNLRRLSEIHEDKDIRSLTTAQFPGSHCPLMGAMMAIGGIEDAIMLVLGTDECAYYTKQATINGFSFGGIDNRCFSVVIDQHDVTFGCREKLQSAFAELMQEIAPAAVFLVTTCVLEITGDDVDSMADELSSEYQIPVLPVHTEHFKSANHLPGVRDTITACLPLIENPLNNQKAIKRVNVIGQRLGKFQDTELYRVLSQRGIEIGLMLPGGASLQQIRSAADAQVNIVVNDLGLPFAEKMERKFGVPYVMFDKYVDPDHIMQAYQTLFHYLHLDIDSELMDLYHRACTMVSDTTGKVNGMQYIYGNTALNCMEYNLFMIQLGMVPQLIQLNEIKENELEFCRQILTCYDPYVTKTANIAALQTVYDLLKPNLYLGHEFAARLRAKGIALVHGDGISSMLGFEVTMAVVQELIRASNEARELRQKGNNI